MSVTSPASRFTRADYRTLPEGFPAQLIEGVLVKEPAPTIWHQRLVGRLYHAFRAVVGEARVLFSPLDFAIDDENVFQPDVAVFRQPLETGPDEREIETPLLVVEVLSKATESYDRHVKVSRYLDEGVEEVWLVDPAAHTIEVRTSAGHVTRGPGGSVESTVVEGLTLETAELFRP